MEVWQDTEKYLAPRAYDRAHFFGDDAGYFVAIQSWIPKAGWLPQRYASKTAFYRDMEDWLATQALPGSDPRSVPGQPAATHVAITTT